MKARIIATGLLVATLSMGVVGCGKGGSTDAASLGETAAPTEVTSGEFATLGDVLAAETDSMSSTFDQDHYACTFSSDGVWWHVEADLEEGMADKLNEVWVSDDAKVEELLSPIATTKVEKLEAPTDDEVNALVGKTGAELKDAGFKFKVGGVAVNGNETDCTATKGYFDYLITFDGAVADEDTADPTSAVADLKVSSIALQGVTWDVLE